MAPGIPHPYYPPGVLRQPGFICAALLTLAGRITMDFLQNFQ
jgi:hypothetical protein